MFAPKAPINDHSTQARSVIINQKLISLYDGFLHVGILLQLLVSVQTLSGMSKRRFGRR